MKELIRFQTDRSLDKKPFELENEVASVFEELLEASGLDVSKQDRPELKLQLKMFKDLLVGVGVAKPADTAVSNHDQVDAFTDVIVFAVGAGSMVDGKFEKDLSEEAKANWYKADYSKSTIR